MRILDIEDDFVCRRLLGSFLTEYGQVSTAVDGPDGLSTLWNATAECRPFDLVMLDVQMPGIDGLEVLRQVRAAERGEGRAPTKVVITTASDRLQVVSEAYEALCDDYLTKPVRRANVLLTMERLGLVAKG